MVSYKGISVLDFVCSLLRYLLLKRSFIAHPNLGIAQKIQVSKHIPTTCKSLFSELEPQQMMLTTVSFLQKKKTSDDDFDLERFQFHIK